METLRIGDKAFYDSYYAGLVPCKVVAITGTAGPAGLQQRVTCITTARRGPYKRGEKIETFGLHAVPRRAVVVRGGQYRIRAYNVETNNS